MRGVITLLCAKMSLYTDPLCLNKHRLFLELKNSLSGNIKDTRNILEIRDNVLYVWNANDSCVMTLNVAASREKDGDVLYQVSQQRSIHNQIIRFIDNLDNIIDNGKKNNEISLYIELLIVHKPNLYNVYRNARKRFIFYLHSYLLQ